ncbi:glycosyl hydrolase family 28-related protein [Peribacillus simplex]|uniref:glycosyl hydrolase family 28-related protein n=1 Tax=Peribacillus simplex TaxID=1478 RepID=UPI0024C1B8B4|nr:glycosyl hydrolase family 28-related protein [Peribacillus simplex]WHY55215.1 glycosyl hydrolase family 28-related protein [Peribacillus simplex]
MFFKDGDLSSNSIENNSLREEMGELSIRSESIRLKDFGAVGDGVTDDTIAINSAISFAFNNKKALDFESGTYVYDRATTLFMDGAFDGRFIDWVGRSATVLFKRLDIAYFSFFKMEYINIVGINFEGPGAVGVSPNQNAIGIGVYSSKRLYVGNCSFTNFVGDGLFISSEQVNDRNKSTQSMLIQNCYFNNNGRGGLTVVGCVSGNITCNHFGGTKLLLAPIVGDVLHIESDPSKRYAIDSLSISNNLIYGTVNLSNWGWQTGWIGDKDTWMSFHNNKVVIEDDQYAIISTGGNLKITDNEIEITRITPDDDLGIGAIFLKCNSAIIERNTIKTTGKGTIISIYNWTHDNKGKIIFKENIYITNRCSYVYRFYKDSGTKFSNYHNIVKIINENYLDVKVGNWLFSAAQSGGSALKYYLEGLTWAQSNGMEVKNPKSNQMIYLRDCLITPSSSLLTWDKSGTAIKVYHENCRLSGSLTEGIRPFPININAVFKINSSGNGEDDSAYTTNIIGRVNTISKIRTGKYEWDSFTKGELYNYTFAVQLLLESADSETYFLNLKGVMSDGEKLLFEVKNEKNSLVDLPINTRILISGRMLSNSAISVLAT